MVYAPRDEDEVEIVKMIVRAAAWWVGGVDVEADERALGSGKREEVKLAPAREGTECQMPGLVQESY
jgi:hypothetical protein